MFKRFHLWLTTHYSAIKHALLIALGISLLIFSMIVMAGQNRLINQVRTLSEQNKTLSEDNQRLNKETKKLGEDNQTIAKQNRSYTRCIATIFAQYTQDFVPVVINDLDTCTLDSRSQATNNSATGTSDGAPTTNGGGGQGFAGQTGGSQAQSSSSGNDNTSDNPPPSDNSQPIKVLGIPICVPLTKVCVTR